MYPTVCETTAAGVSGELTVVDVRSMCDRLWIVLLCGAVVLISISVCVYKLIVAISSDEWRIHPALSSNRLGYVHAHYKATMYVCMNIHTCVCT